MSNKAIPITEKAKDWNKWMVIYNNGEKETDIEYLSDSQHNTFLEAIKKSDSQVILKDGRILPTYGRVTRNPNWVDQDLVEKLKERIAKEKERVRKKYDEE